MSGTPACGARLAETASAVTPRLDTCADLRQPFAVAAIEQQHPVAGFRAHHMQQIMRLALRPAATATPAPRSAVT